MIAARLEEMRFDRRRSPERLESEMQILKSELRAMESRTDKMYQRAARHLRRNRTQSPESTAKPCRT